MACAKCAFYVPKGSSRAQLLESQGNLLRMLQEIPLLEDERAAVEDGLGAVEKLLIRLADTPTPAGPTPRELGSGNIIPLTAIAARPAQRSSSEGDPTPHASDESAPSAASPSPQLGV